MDDMAVKTRNSSTLIDDLEETFASLREYRWKLNPNKCIFGVPSGKLLGFIISQRGIEANPEKISAITSMKAPTSIKDIQKLTGCMAALNRFISRLGERGLPFFKLLKHQEQFVCTPEADQALPQLKDFLLKPPILTAPHKGEQLLLYLAATTHVVSTAIVVERQEDATPIQSSAQSTSSARFYQSPRHTISLCRSSVRSTHHLAEATTLLPAVLNIRRHRLPARRHPAEPRCYWKNLQVGGRSRRPHHRLQATHSHQVAGTSRLDGRMAGESAAYSHRAT
jgi:hypothetical protein